MSEGASGADRAEVEVIDRELSLTECLGRCDLDGVTRIEPHLSGRLGELTNGPVVVVALRQAPR